MSKDLPVGLRKKQAAARQATLSKIQGAIDELRENSEEVTKKRLIEITGLAASTFSKDHVKNLLQSNEVCQYKPRVTSEQNAQELIQKHFAASSDQKDKEIASLKQKLAKATLDADTLKGKYNELDAQYKRLLGMYHTLQRKCFNLGIDDSID